MDIKGYFKFIDNLDFEHYYSISTTLESNAKVLEVAGAYGDALVAAGFTRKSDSDRTARYEKGNELRCLMDYDAHKGEGTYFNIWFVF